jgi:hypothetical protein
MTEPKQVEKYDGLYNDLGKPDAKFGLWSVYVIEHTHTFRVAFNCPECKQSREWNIHGSKVFSLPKLSMRHCRFIEGSKAVIEMTVWRKLTSFGWLLKKTKVVKQHTEDTWKRDPIIDEAPKVLVSYLQKEAKEFKQTGTSWEQIEREGQRMF